MAATERKSAIPLKETIVVPYNNGAVFTSGSMITILFGSGEANTLMVQDSFFQFDYEITVEGNDQGVPPANTYIRWLPMIFDHIEVIYGGEKIWNQDFNQQAQLIDWVQKGGDYLDSMIYTGTTSKNLAYTNMKLTTGATPNKLYSCIIRLDELFKCFSGANEIPLNELQNQIQLNLFLADPATYLLQASNDTTNNQLKLFSPIINSPTIANGISISDFSISRFEFHLKDKVAFADRTGDGGYSYPFTMNQIALRGINDATFPPGSSVNIPFSIVTNNVEKMGIYFYKAAVTGAAPNPCSSFRPELINVNFKFGTNTSPFTPINVDNFVNPGVYKAIINSTFDIARAEFATNNYDFQMSYAPLAYQYTGTRKEDSHIVLAVDFTSSEDILGSPSYVWNSQYILQANTSGQSLPACQACMWVVTKYILAIEGGKLTAVNA